VLRGTEYMNKHASCTCPSTLPGCVEFLRKIVKGEMELPELHAARWLFHQGFWISGMRVPASHR
jgi:hypothetical protein